MPVGFPRWIPAGCLRFWIDRSFAKDGLLVGCRGDWPSSVLSVFVVPVGNSDQCPKKSGEHSSYLGSGEIKNRSNNLVAGPVDLRFFHHELGQLASAMFDA